MTPAQREIAELLKSLGRPAEAICANAGLPLEAVKAWLKSGKWPESKQGRLFDRDELNPRPETTQPVNAEDAHGLSIFAAAD